MNLKRRRGNKSTGASGDASVATTPSTVTPSTSTAAAIASARIAAAAVISGMAVTTEPPVTAGFATGIGASRAVIARGAALPFRALIAQYDPADDKRPNHDDQRQ
jgi:hypothetical protein